MISTHFFYFLPLLDVSVLPVKHPPGYLIFYQFIQILSKQKKIGDISPIFLMLDEGAVTLDDLPVIDGTAHGV